MSNPEDMERLSLHDKHAKPKPKSYVLLWIFLCLIVIIGATLWFVRDVILHDPTGAHAAKKQTRSLPTESLESTASNPADGAVLTDATGPEGTLEGAPKGGQASPMGILDMLDGGKKIDADGVALDGNDVTLDADGNPLPQTLGAPLLDADGNPILDADGNPMYASVAGENSAETLADSLEDAVVRKAFIHDVAPWLVSLYYPKNTHPEARKSGIVMADISRINQRYGIQMTGLSWSGEDINQGRATVLEYLFAPSMIDVLYTLYVDHFMASVAEASKQKRADGSVLTASQVEEMYTLYANHLRSYAAALEGIVRMNGLSRSVEAWQLTTDKALEANTDFTAKLFDYEQARDAGRTAEAAEARKQMDMAGKAYQQAIIMRERARESLAESLRSNVDARRIGRLDESSLLYLAAWVKRRLDISSHNKESVQAISLALKDLGTRFDAAKEAMKGAAAGDL